MFSMHSGRDGRTHLAAGPAILALAASLFLTRAQAQDAASAQPSGGAAAGTGQAAEAAPDTPSLQELEEKIGILERKLELGEEDAAKKKDETPLFSAGKDGFSVRSPDGDFQLKWRGAVQTDGRWFLEDTAHRLSNTWLVRRVDPLWEATAWKYLSFRIMAEFAGSFSLQDAHVDLAYWPAFKFRFGKFKAPIGQERLQSFSETFLVENAFPTYLTPNRDVGALIYGDLLGETVNYSLGLFNGSVDNGNRDVDSTDEKSWTGRVFALPFKKGNSELLRNLGLGFAASYGEQFGDSAFPTLGSVRTPGQQGAFSYRTNVVSGSPRDSATARANGTQIRLNPHGYWFWNNLGLYGEWISSSQEVSNRKQNEPEELTHTAWLAGFSWVLTGESPSLRGVRPRHPLAPKNSGATASPASGVSGFGALELVGQFSRFEADSKTFPLYANYNQVKQADSYGIGLNWYLTRNVRWYFNYVQTVFDGGIQLPARAANAAQGITALPARPASRPDEKVIFTRLQFVL